MKQYQFLLFDLDDTLLDFKAAEQLALPKLFKAQQFPLTEEVYQVYKEINKGLWHALEQGEITQQELMATRFAKTFEALGKKVDGRALDAEFRGYLAESKVFVEGAFELIQSLAPNYELYVTSNGISETQTKRIQVTGLAPYFKHVFASEETGYQKPLKPFFDYVFERIPQFDPEKTMIIGDSYSADIVGGAGAGIDTCWLNPERKEAHAMIQPTYTIDTLSQLIPILDRAKSLQKITGKQ
ncbi:YjjG family noncanonical pyrimidine nucleotidase [Solibacillus sp. FSL K6-1523]|uniref:YjjG family noncanonical pyrimidine nucleotidase n=1 Tax=Solibacillus sp. FSL K6-1523 TaxID=2921471 RepID=UPI0030F4FF02